MVNIFLVIKYVILVNEKKKIKKKWKIIFKLISIMCSVNYAVKLIKLKIIS